MWDVWEENWIQNWGDCLAGVKVKGGVELEMGGREGCGGRLRQRMRGSARQHYAIASSESAASWLPSKLGRHSLSDAPRGVPLVRHSVPVFSTVTQFGHRPFSVHRVTLRFGEFIHL